MAVMSREEFFRATATLQRIGELCQNYNLTWYWDQQLDWFTVFYNEKILCNGNFQTRYLVIPTFQFPGLLPAARIRLTTFLCLLHTVTYKDKGAL